MTKRMTRDELLEQLLVERFAHPERPYRPAANGADSDRTWQKLRLVHDSTWSADDFTDKEVS